MTWPVTTTSISPLLTLIDETDELLVVCKPAGLVCHPSKAGPTSSLIGRVRLYLGHDEGRLVHRLDRETSGLVVVAKGAAVAAELGRVFAGNAVTKTYRALVHGHIAGASMSIDAPLGRDDESAVAIKDGVRADGATARTTIVLAERFDSTIGPCSLVDVVPRSGRKHQIRIHLAHIGHPIVGDKIYGADESRYLRFVVGALTAGDRAALGLDHHALHASDLDLVWRDRRWAWSAGMSQVQTWLKCVEAVAI
jgi:23S rRNA pseudouridine1911/1915/1917 synthase